MTQLIVRIRPDVVMPVGDNLREQCVRFDEGVLHLPGVPRRDQSGILVDLVHLSGSTGSKIDSLARRSLLINTSDVGRWMEMLVRLLYIVDSPLLNSPCEPSPSCLHRPIATVAFGRTDDLRVLASEAVTCRTCRWQTAHSRPPILPAQSTGSKYRKTSSCRPATITQLRARCCNATAVAVVLVLVHVLPVLLL